MYLFILIANHDARKLHHSDLNTNIRYFAGKLLCTKIADGLNSI